MARVTVEDCVEKIQNRFELVMMASSRAKSLEKGSTLTVDRDNDKNTVVALREIAEGTIDLDVLKSSLVTNLQKLRAQEEEPTHEVEDIRAIDMAMDDDLMGISDDEDALSSAGFNEATDNIIDDEA